ncbi:MAG: hypothetical protein MJZ36_01445 [Bacteroidaceae bacterium]|nr:hypothetical protein [Bacteroidaceae bacterium]
MRQYTEVDHIYIVEEVEAFFAHIVKERKINFHPDNNFEDYINIESHEPSFTPSECSIYNRLMDECFTICDQANVDIYEIGLKALGLDWMLEDVA